MPPAADHWRGDGEARKKARAAAFLLLFWITAAMQAFVVPPAALAQDNGNSGGGGGRATVRVDGRALFRVGGGSEGESASDRARRAERRLMTLLEKPGAIASARVESAKSGGGRIVTVAGVPVVTVTPGDAEDNLTDVDALAAQWAQATDAALSRAAARRQSAWGRFVTEVRGSVQTAFARLLESGITIIPRGLAAVVVMALFWLLASGARWLMRLIFRRVVSDLTVENLIKQIAYYAIWTLGLVVTVDALGFNPQTVATGLGLTGIALGFALKDIISNFVSGLLILLLRPFQIGDQIVVGPTEGTVERITLRATEMRAYDGRIVLVPNAEVFTSRVTNNTADPVRRGSVDLFLGYDADLREAAQVIDRAMQSAEGVLADPPASVRVRDLGPDDIRIEARFWTDSRRSDFLATQSAVRFALIDALRQAGIGLPDPDVRALALRDARRWRTVLSGGGGSDNSAAQEG